MEDAVHAIIMAFSVLIFVFALSVAMYMLSQVNTTAETFLYYADKTNYYDNIELEPDQINRKVDFDTIIPTLYRYYKENFCVKICDNDGSLVQIFDVNLEGEVRQAAAKAISNRSKKQKALNSTYNNKTKPEYLFEAPWIGSTDDNIKARIDLFVNGKAAYINNTYVDYENNKFYKARLHNEGLEDDKTVDNHETIDNQKVFFTEEFVSYTYDGETITTDDGELLVAGSQPEDKIVIIYTANRDLDSI